MRAADTDGPLRQGIAYNVEELRLLISGGRLPSEKVGKVRIEQALSGYREVEVELLRDAANRMQVVALAENMDPVGVHSGDSAAVVPPLTITEPTRRQIETAAFKLAEQIQVTGSLHVKVAVAPAADQVLVLAINPWFSRMSAFCSKAFGIDLATIHARLSTGTGLDEILDLLLHLTSIDRAGAGWVAIRRAAKNTRNPPLRAFPGDPRRCCGVRWMLLARAAPAPATATEGQRRPGTPPVGNDRNTHPSHPGNDRLRRSRLLADRRIARDLCPGRLFSLGVGCLLLHGLYAEPERTRPDPV